MDASPENPCTALSGYFPWPLQGCWVLFLSLGKFYPCRNTPCQAFAFKPWWMVFRPIHPAWIRGFVQALLCSTASKLVRRRRRRRSGVSITRALNTCWGKDVPLSIRCLWAVSLLLGPSCIPVLLFGNERRFSLCLQSSWIYTGMLLGPTSAALVAGLEVGLGRGSWSCPSSFQP